MELYMVCVLVAIALAMAIIKTVMFVISIIYPIPDAAEMQWRQNPTLPLDEHKKAQKQVNQQNQHQTKTNYKQKPLPPAPIGKRPPRNVRLEQLYSPGSPLSFDEIDSSFGRRSLVAQSTTGIRGRPSSRYNEMAMMNMSFTSGDRESVQHSRIPLDQIDFVEDDLDDPIEAYVQEQHQRMLRQQEQRSSTPIQSYSRPSKSHATIV